MSTEIKITEWKTTVHILSSSQSGIAVLKNVLADGRLMSSPPLPPHHTPSFAPTDHPYTLYLLEQSVGEPEGVGGEEGEQSSSTSRFLGNSGALSVLKQIVHKSSSLYRLFHSVIFNSVVMPQSV